MTGTLVCVLAGMLSLSYGYDQTFCSGRRDGNHCDPDDQTGYYVCSNQITSHFTCQTGTIVGVDIICVYAYMEPCVPSRSSSVTQTSPGKILSHVYRRHTGKKSACALLKTKIATSARECGTICSRSYQCTDYNFSTMSTTNGMFTCQLVRCDVAFLLAPSSDFHFYERI